MDGRNFLLIFLMTFIDLIEFKIVTLLTFANNIEYLLLCWSFLSTWNAKFVPLSTLWRTILSICYFVDHLIRKYNAKLLPRRPFPRSSLTFPSFRVWFCQTLPKLRKRMDPSWRDHACWWEPYHETFLKFFFKKNFKFEEKSKNVDCLQTELQVFNDNNKVVFSDLCNGDAVLIRYNVNLVLLGVLEVEALGHICQTGRPAQVRWVRQGSLNTCAFSACGFAWLMRGSGNTAWLIWIFDSELGFIHVYGFIENNNWYLSFHLSWGWSINYVTALGGGILWH